MTIAPYDTSRKVATHNDARASWKRVTPHTPCTICGAKKYCEYTDDGAFHCMNEEAARARGGHPYNYRGGGFLITADKRRPQTVRLVPSQPEPTPIVVTPEPERANDVDTLHAVYTSLFELCKLSQPHGEVLTGPGHDLTREQALRYRTLPRDSREVCVKLEQRHGRATVMSVPGFIEKDGRIEARGAGMIMPTRDTRGRIVAVDVRRERTEPGQAKYFKLSSGTVGGPSSGTPAHVAQPSALRDARTVYVTEGVKKADVAADALGCVVIGLVGHTTWRQSVDALDELAEGGATECIIALDRDSNLKTVAEVDRSRRQLAAAAAEMGYAVRLAVWDAAAAKGLDDLLQAGLTPLRERYRPVLAEGEAHAQLAAQCKTLQAKHDAVTRLMTTPHMKPTDKAVAHTVWTLTNQYPDACGDEPPPLIRLDRDYIARQAGVSESTVTKALPDVAALGIIRREVHRDPLTGLGELWVGGGRFPETPWTKDDLQTAGRAKDRARKVCPNCGSTHLAVRSYVCEDCNTVCTAEEASDAGEVAARTAYVAEREQFTREDADGERREDDELPESATADEAPGQTTVDARGRVIDMETGEILHSAPAMPAAAAAGDTVCAGENDWETCVRCHEPSPGGVCCDSCKERLVHP